MLIRNLEELENLLGISLTKKQRKIFNRRETFILYGGSMSSGKSFVISFIALFYCLRYDGATCLIGRKFHSSLTKTTQIILEKLIYRLPKGYLFKHNRTEGYFEFKNGSRIYMIGLADSAEHLDKIRGVEIVAAFIDECQDLDNAEAFQMLSTRLRQKIKGASYKLILTGNPTRKKWLRELFIDEKRKDFYFLKALPKDNPHLPKGYLRLQKETLPALDYKILILGSWEDAQTVDCLFEKEKVEEAIKNNKWIRGGVSYGIDFSLSGTSAIAKKSGNKISLPIVMKNTDMDKLIEKIKKKITSKEVPIYIDAIGEGSGLCSILEKEGYNIIRVRQNEQAIDFNKYYNLRAENYDRLNQLLEEGLNLPNDQELKNQMLLTKKEFHSDGRIKIESKLKLIKRGRSPDKLDAVVLSCLGSGIEEEVLKDEYGRLYELNKWGQPIYWGNLM